MSTIQKMNTAPFLCNPGSEPLCIAGLSSRLKSARGQRGLTLVELMVSMAIGLFVVLVVTTVFVQGLNSVSFRMGQGENLSNGRYTIGGLENALSKVGYRRSPLQDVEEAFPVDAIAAANGCQFAVGQAIYAPDTKSLCIRYQARDNADTDCAGNAANLSADTVKPYVSPVIGTGLFVEKYSLSYGSLVCAAGGSATVAPTTTAIADGIKDLHFDFGVGNLNNSLGERVVKQFQTTSPVGNDLILALRYAVLLNSSSKNITQNMESTVCSRWAAAGGDSASCSNTGQLNQLAVGYLALRNLMP